MRKTGPKTVEIARLKEEERKKDAQNKARLASRHRANAMKDK